jgi:DNA mismatch repair ATPase MutL
MVFYLKYGVKDMNQFKKKILAAGILLALGSVTSAWAQPTNEIDGDENTITSTSTIDNSDNSTNDNSNSSTNSSNNTDDNSNNSTNSSNNTDDNSNNSTNSSNNTDDNSNSSVNSSNNTADNSNSSTNDSNNSTASVGSGNGSAAANGGDATADYKVNESTLAGTVTGTGTAPNWSGEDTATYTASNNITDAFNGTAGINQMVQNTGSGALVQQQVSFQGNVNVNQ